ncbi:uncharacterized protein LOC122041876 isoform X1 [Zingiber officinale]|uniref:uncharacterized protein LOC122041876 isoform X1 n=1 Tax=Zingiber officinale TaxID=94328 RepID=UPI001C4AFDAF|nr:uncharacterized protein LOC122041876 isoform X1 [Zingiber officinale]
MHTNYSVLYKKSFPPQTAPAGYVYPTCSASLGATTRKLTYNDRKYSESSYHAADEDGTNKKYTRRGNLDDRNWKQKFLSTCLLEEWFLQVGHAWQRWEYCTTNWHRTV